MTKPMEQWGKRKTFCIRFRDLIKMGNVIEGENIEHVKCKRYEKEIWKLKRNVIGEEIKCNYEERIGIGSPYIFRNLQVKGFHIYTCFLDVFKS